MLDATQKPDRPTHLNRCRRCGRGSIGLAFQSTGRLEGQNGKLGSNSIDKSGCGILYLVHAAEREHNFLIDTKDNRRKVEDEPGFHEALINY